MKSKIQRVFPVLQFDASYAQLCRAALYCLFPPFDTTRANREIRSGWLGDREVFGCLSVRTGFDLFLQAAKLPKGSEVLVSGMTIRDMLSIVEHHGLVVVPVDLDIDTLDAPRKCWEAAITPKTKAIMFTHLFGSHADTSVVASIAKDHKLLFLEDCAQAYAGYNYEGNPEADVTMFSFGSIKTATAFGGGVLHIHTKALAERMHNIMEAYPRQTRRQYAVRILRYMVLQPLAKPIPYGLLVFLCSILGIDHDAIVRSSVRGFPPQELIRNIRHQPASPLLRMMAFKIRTYDMNRLWRRTELGNSIAEQLPSQFSYAGRGLAAHSFWLFPLIADKPAQVQEHLRRDGIDASANGTTLVVAEGRSGKPPQLLELSQHIMYIPLGPMARQDTAEKLLAGLRGKP